MSLMFYSILPSYIEFLRAADARVPFVAGGKERRPFIGVLIEVGTAKYYAPLSSPKPKHLLMKGAPDIVRINSGRWGVINLNNMLPDACTQ